MRLPDFKLERYFATYEFAVRHLLCASDCESVTVGDILGPIDDAPDWFMDLWLGYTEAPGSPDLRSAITEIYPGLYPGQVLVCSGAEEAIFLTLHALLGPGDHAIVHWPCYQSLHDVALSTGASVDRWVARPENGWALDLVELQRLLRPNTRLVIVNFPHNPTGALMPQADFARLVQIVDDAGAVLFSDEVYRESEYRPADTLPPACTLSERAVSLGVMSKTYGLAGLRIGWLATRNRALYAKVAALKDYTTICNSAPSEFLAAMALRQRQALAERNRQIILSNLALLDRFFADFSASFAWVRPQAGPVAFPRLLTGPIEPFCQRLVANAGVLLLPGTLFDYPGDHFRIGFGRASMPTALDALKIHLMTNVGL